MPPWVATILTLSWGWAIDMRIWSKQRPGAKTAKVLAKDILPEAVSVDKEGSLGLRYTEIIPVLVKGIQELDAYNKELFQRNNDSNKKLISFEDEARLRIKALELKAERLEARILALESP